MTATKISKRTVDGLQPTDRDVFLWDADLGGFGVRCRKNGAKYYVLKYRYLGRQGWLTIGRHGSPRTPELARREARRLLGEKDVVLSTRPSLLGDLDAVGIAAALSSNTNLIGPASSSFSDLVRSKPICLCDELQHLGPKGSTLFFINTLPHQAPTISLIERLLDLSESTDRYLFRLFLFERFGADPDLEQRFEGLLNEKAIKLQASGKVHLDAPQRLLIKTTTKIPERGLSALSTSNCGQSRSSKFALQNRVDFVAINAVAKVNLLPILKRWLLDGQRQGDEYVALNPHRSDRHLGSFRVNLRTCR